MIEKLYLNKHFGVGPVGLFATTLIWYFTYLLERAFHIPQMHINPTLRIMLLSVFLVDAVYLIIGSNYYLIKNGYDEKIIKDGPFQHIRHPIYGAAIYSFTGIIAILAKSWGLFIAVVPITFIWSWLVQVEENIMLDKFGNEYAKYIEQTGQFLPSWQAMKNKVEEQK